MLLLDKDIQVDPETTEDAVAFRVFNLDPTFAPAGQTAVVCVLTTYNHEYWCGLREKDAVRYEAEKERVAAAVTAVFESRFPKARGRVQVVDVATPRPSSTTRATGGAAWRAGSIRRPRASGSSRACSRDSATSTWSASGSRPAGDCPRD